MTCMFCNTPTTWKIIETDDNLIALCSKHESFDLL